MDFEAMPIIKIEVQRLNHAVMAHLGAAGSELGERIDEEIKRQIKEFPWEEVVKSTIIECVGKEINEFFKFGPGGAAIRSAVYEAFKELDQRDEDDVI